MPLGAIGAFAVRIGAAGVAYLVQILLARTLGAAEYGTFSFAWSLVTIGGFLATLGFGQIAVRFLAEYQAAGDCARAQGFMRHAILVTLAGSLALGSLLYIMFPLVEQGYGILCCAVLGIGILALPFFAMTDLFEGFARSQGWTIRALAPAYLFRTGLLGLGLLVAVGVGWRVDALFAIIVALGATVAAAILQLVWTGPALLRVFPRAPSLREYRAWHGNAAPTLLSDLALLARQNIDLIVLGLLAPPATVGLYFAATRIASLIGLVEFAIGAAYGHRFARAKVETGGKGHAVFREARRLMQVGGVGGAVAIVLALPLILGMFGRDFSDAYVPATILLAGMAIRMSLGPMEDMLQMAGFAADVWRANAIGALTTALLCLVLAGPWQATGAAIGAAIGSLAATLMLWLAFRRHAHKPAMAGHTEPEAGR